VAPVASSRPSNDRPGNTTTPVDVALLQGAAKPSGAAVVDDVAGGIQHRRRSRSGVDHHPPDGHRVPGRQPAGLRFSV
jgi:hypothetical protein